jgi:hypothetical protein
MIASSLHAGTRDADWKKVEDAIQKGLPKTAITNLEPIIQGALKDKAYAEAVKAIGKRIALEGNIEGNKPEEKITRLEAEIAKAPAEMGPMLNTLLAHWYWQYFQQNRWRFMQRTATAQAPGKDFTTWDLPRLFAEIDKQYQKALAGEAALKATPVTAWNDLLEKGTMPDSYRPTLYDFVAHEALEFYTSGEQAGANPEDHFELAADSPALEEATKFLAWSPPIPANEPNASVLRALRLYQGLLRFHQNDPAPRPAFAASDLERLAWAWNTAFGEDKNARYKAALEAFIRENADFEISALALEKQARVLQQEDDLVAAHTLAKRGASLFPTSPGGKLCQNLVQEIEAKSASISTERVWNCGVGVGTAGAGSNACPHITVRYRNVTNVYFRAVAWHWESLLKQQYGNMEYFNAAPEWRKEVLAKKPDLEWSENLPPTADFREKAVAFHAPDKLAAGFYYILASHDPSFGETENVVSAASVWVSDLAFVTRMRFGFIEGFVLDAASGEPLANAEVSVWHMGQDGTRMADPSLKTDQEGFFAFRGGEPRSYLMRARYQGRELAAAGDVWSYGEQQWPKTRPSAQTIFFTDRVIYRPGQTIQYKGICVWVDQEKDNYEVLKGEKLTVVFRDVNGKEIARQDVRANDYGSFSGSFTAPRDRLMGAMSLRADGRAQGGTTVRVEEYKRPKFEVTLDSPKTAAKLNERASLTGHATSYTGAAVDGAQVRYRVVRQTRMPWWWGWWGRPRPGSDSQEIVHGIAKTEVDGSFKIEFIARPDPKVPEKDEPTFTFQVHADVTDTTGETRSADHAINAGYTALEARVSADDWQTEDKAVALSISTQTLDGEPQVAEGTLKVFALQSPPKVHRALLVAEDTDADSRPDKDLSDPNNWELGKVVGESGFTTDTNGQAKLSFKLPVGAYRAVLETQDRFGKKVTGKLPIQVLNPADTRLVIKIPHLLAAPEWESQPGEEFMALWGTGYETGRAFIEIEQRNTILQRYWTKPGQTQQQIKLAVTEALRGGFTVHVTQVRENRGYLASRHISVPWKQKDLTLKWGHFVSKLQPGQKESWTVQISGPETKAGAAERAAAEMVATLYDESLDAFTPLGWLTKFGFFRQDGSSLQSQFANTAKGLQQIQGGWSQHFEGVTITYRSFPEDLVANLMGFQFFSRRYAFGGRGGAPMTKAGAAQPEVMADSQSLAAPASLAAAEAPALYRVAGEAAKEPAPAPPPPPAPKPDLGAVQARKNLNETAFFFPQLTTDSNGIVTMNFTMPEALTRWRFLGFAHDSKVRSGFLEAHTVTAKDLMVQPNPPRFLREGDTIEFTVKVSNQSDKQQTGTVKLSFNQALDNQSADKMLNLQAVAAGHSATTEQSFDIPAKQSRTFAWRLTVPDNCGFLTYKAVGATASVSDGEEGGVPVLSRRILVTESLPLPIRGPGTKNFEFTKLLQSGSSKTLRNQSLTVQMVSHPAWYAVLALPYLMEYPYECSEQTFNRFYANSLARAIANRDPKIRRVFDLWKNTPTLDSPLEKNQDLKSVMIEETPWVRQAAAESQARRNVGILFDENRLNNEIETTLSKLRDMQVANGLWPWFPGGQGNDYITLYIVTGFGRLRHLGVDVRVDVAIRSLDRLDVWMNEQYARIQTWPNPETYVPSATDALYLYGRSFFLKDRPVSAANRKALDFYLAQARKLWLKTDNRQTQAQLALALRRFDASDPTPAAIMASLRERSVSNEEMGMFWRDTELSWWWYRAPIETQALMIEAFDEVAHDAKAVEDCRVWLLKQKQTQDWKTTKATADAVYALLLRGTDLLSSDALVEVKLDGVNVLDRIRKPEGANPKPIEAGTGFYEYRFPVAEIKPKLGEITVKKSDAGVAWGSVHWQSLEDMSKVTPYEGTPLKLKKTLYTKVNTARGPVIEPLKGAVQVGDELVVRVELRVDRDMEYVHLKDQRGSGTEPVNVLSRYQYQDGLAYYESTRDTASHFFIDYLPKGTYVFEYSTRVQLRGQYQTGVAEIQCMYAPEFNSHSESVGLTVK